MDTISNKMVYVHVKLLRVGDAYCLTYARVIGLIQFF